MPVERQRWRPVVTMIDGNAQLRRIVDVLDASVRVDVQSITASQTVALTFPHTLLKVDTTGGSVTATLPPAATVPGFRVDVVKLVAANTVTVDGYASETISGAATLAWTTQWQTYTLLSIDTGWVIV